MLKGGRTVKKTISLLICFIMTVSCFAFTASAMSASEGLEALESQFADGKNDFDYVYYTPVKKTSDTKKYPLIIWLHGQFSGNDKRYQLENCDVALWSSDEYQAKIKGTGGAFIFLPRDPTLQLDLAWNGAVSDLKRSIDQFVLKYKKNIDTSRIYLGGFSMGGKAVIKLAAAYPGYFAAIFPMSSTYNPSTSDLKSLKDTPIWMFTCRSDYINTNLNAHAIATNMWKYWKTNSSCKDVNRWTYFISPLVNPNGITPVLDPIYSVFQHNTWDAVAHDLILNSGKLYSNMITLDGDGQAITLSKNETFLSWLSSQDLDGPVKDDDDEPDKEPELPSTSVLESIEKIFKFILRFIEILFK